MVRSKNMTPRNIRAAVLRKKDGPLKIEKLSMEGPQDTEVLIRTVASGVCHTDISMVHHWEEADGPQVLGHEGAGIVELTGKKVKAVRPGDHVVLSYQSCGTCRGCKNGRPTKCRRFYELNFGFQRQDGSNALERKRRAGTLLRPVLFFFPHSGNRTQHSQGFQKTAAGNSGAAGLRNSNRSRHCDEHASCSER